MAPTSRRSGNGRKTHEPLGTGRVPRRAEPLRQKTLVKLREAIASGQFKPDDRLVERDICAKTGVSRSSVREALRYLESEGLVESRGTKGMFVVNLSSAEAMEIYELRTTVEADAAIRFAERASADDIRHLAEIFATIKVAALSDADRYWRQTDLLFDLMMRGAGNVVAYGLMTSLRTRIRYLRSTTTRFATPEYRQGTVEHLAGLTDALVQRDGTLAAARVRRFVERSARFAAECLAHRDEVRSAESRQPDHSDRRSAVVR